MSVPVFEAASFLDELEPRPGQRSHLLVVAGSRGRGRSAVLSDFADRLRHGEAPPVVIDVRAARWEASRKFALLHLVAPKVDLGSAADSFDVAERLVSQWVSEHADRPLAIIVDDADLSDIASVQALSTMVRHHRELPVLVIASIDSERASQASALLGSTCDTHISLGPVTVEEATQLAARIGIALHPSLAEHLIAHTSGRRARIISLLESEPRDTWRGATPSLPATALVLDHTRGVVEALDEDSRTLAYAVAVLDGNAPVALAATVAELDDPLTSVDVLERVGVVRRRYRATSTDIEVVDPMVAAALRTAMGPVLEARLHRRAAEHVDDDASRLLHAVRAQSGPDENLAAQLHDLATDRAGQGAWADAARLFQAASRTSPNIKSREHRLLLTVDALVGAGDVQAASSYLPEIESLGETAMRSAVLGYLAILRGRRAEAAARLERAWQLESGQRHPSVAASTAHRHVLHYLAQCDGAELVTWADRTVELVGSDHPTAVEAQAILGLGLGSTGRLKEALESYRTLWGHASHGAMGQRVQMGSGWLHLAADDIDRARSQLSTAVPTDYLGGSIRISLWARAWLARTHFVSGEWESALAQAEAGLEQAKRSGVTLLIPLLQWTVVQIHALRGTADPNVHTMPPVSASDYEVMRVPACLTRAALAEARADYTAVLTALAPLTRTDVGPDVAEPGFWPWADIFANALVVKGRFDEATTFLDVHQSRARERGHRSAQARLGYPRGRLLGARGDLPGARRQFETSLELLESLPLIYDRARINFAYGQTLRRAGKRREADAVITAAREDWAALGASTYVRRCDRELKAGGVAGTLRDRPAESLTPQEQAVATLVAQGATNREAAAELFLSVKTVQFHLTRVYAKLGVRSRSELAGLSLALGDATVSDDTGASGSR